MSSPAADSAGRSSGRQRHRWHAAAKSIYGSSGANCRSCPELPLLRTWRGHSHRDITSPYYILISRSLAGVAGGGRRLCGRPPSLSHNCQLKFDNIVQGDSGRTSNGVFLTSSQLANQEFDTQSKLINLILYRVIQTEFSTLRYTKQYEST